MYVSRFSKFGKTKSIAIASILGAIGLILNEKFEIMLFLDLHILLGLTTSWIALFLLRGWWSVVVSIPTLFPVLLLYDEPISGLVELSQIVIITWIYRNKMVDNALGKGHLLFLVIVYSLFIQLPLHTISQHYLVGLSFDVSLLFAYTDALNSTFCILIAYSLYVGYKLYSSGRRVFSENSITIGGLVFLSTYALINVIIVPSMAMAFDLYRSDHVKSYNESMRLQASMLWDHYNSNEGSFDNSSRILDRLDEGVEFSISGNSYPSVQSNPTLLKSLSTDYVALDKQNRPLLQYKQLKILQPINMSSINRWNNAFFFYTYPIDDQKLGDGNVVLVQNANIAALDEAQRFASKEFNFIAICLFWGSIYSFMLSTFATREIETMFSSSQLSLDNDIVDEEDYEASSSFPRDAVTTKYSPIFEISKGVDIISRSFFEVSESRNSIRRLNAIAQKQLSNAGDIQKSFLVKSSPRLGPIDLSLYMKPAYNAGGDWYDAFIVGDKLFLVIADVCDKGVPAALFMSVFRSLIRFNAVSVDWELLPDALGKQMVKVISAVNGYMSLNHADEVMFATVFFASIDTKSELLTYVSAGHESPLIFPPLGQCVQLDTTGPAVGIFRDAVYTSKSMFIPRGTAFVGFTDGVIDGRNEIDQPFTTDRLIGLCHNLLATNPEIASGDLLESIKSELMSHIGQAPQFDDITLATFIYQKI